MAITNPHPTHDLHRPNSGLSGVIKFFDINPPLEEVFIDDDGVKSAFDKHPIIPYSGRNKVSSHKMVSVLYNFCHMSSTYAGFLNDIKYYALKGKLEIVKYEDSIFDIADEQVIGNEQQRKFNQQIKDNFIFHNCDLKELSYWIHDSYDSVGQVGVEVIKKTILNKTTVTFKFHKPNDYVFMANGDIGSEVAISKYWDDKYLDKHPPMIVPLYPYFDKYKDGFERTFYFAKDGAELYGRPNDLSCLPDKYNEYKLKQYLTKKNKKLWLPDVFVETSDSVGGGFNNEEDAKDKGFSSAEDRIARTWTNAADEGSGFIFTNKAGDAPQTFIHEFQGLKNSKEVQTFREMFKESILEANGWSKLLFQMEGATGFSNAVFMDIFAIKAVTKIAEVQYNVATIVNELLNIGFKEVGIQNEYGIKFNSPLKEMLNEYRNKQGSNNEQSKRTDIVGKT